MRRLCGPAALAVIIALLAACGRPAPEQAAPPATSAPGPAEAATSAPGPAEAARPTAPPAGPAQGRTAEGYQALGDPAAPVTLTMYSDFL